MGRPREFDEAAALEAAMRCFWARGYEAASTRELAEEMGITCASLYNAFGDKRSLYRRVLEHYLERSVRERVRRLESTLLPLNAIRACFAEIIRRSVNDRERRGCMLVNSALEMAPHDPAFRTAISKELIAIEAFFRRCVEAGQRGGTISRSQSAEQLAKMLLTILLGIRVLARTRPQKELLEGAVSAAVAFLCSPKAD
jgi:TetR/AcrR family transcriptional repressor of nem operon